MKITTMLLKASDKLFLVFYIVSHFIVRIRAIKDMACLLGYNC